MIRTVDAPDLTRDEAGIPQRRAQRRLWETVGIYGVVVAMQLLVIGPVAAKRAFDGDEGMYALAARLVARGQVPYYDFWFQYTPGIAYVYGLWARVMGESFGSLRTLAALLTVGLGVLIFTHVAHRFSRRLGVATVILYTTSTLVFQWYSTYKSYALSTILLFAGYMVVAGSDRNEPCSSRRWFVAGVFLGLSVDVRLYFIALVPLFAYYSVARTGPIAARFSKIPALFAGLLAGLLPSIYFFVRGPGRFYTDTFLSHTSRSDLSFLDSIVQKLRIADGALGAAQFIVLIGAALMLAVFALATHRRVPLTIAIAGVLGVVSIVPTPTYEQYFSALIPFLVVGAAESWSMIHATLRRPSDRRGAFIFRTIGIIGLLLFVVSGVGAYDAILNTSDFLPGIRAVREISTEIDRHTRPGEIVIDFSPFDLVESHATPLSGLESNFATFAATNLDLSDSQAARFKMITLASLEATIRSKRIRTLVLRPREPLFPRPWNQIAKDAGYLPVATIGDATIYQRP